MNLWEEWDEMVEMRRWDEMDLHGKKGWGGWMASLTRWTWVWASSGRWWWIGKPGMLQSMESQRVGRNWATELNWWEEWGNHAKRPIDVHRISHLTNLIMKILLALLWAFTLETSLHPFFVQLVRFTHIPLPQTFLSPFTSRTTSSPKFFLSKDWVRHLKTVLVEK